MTDKTDVTYIAQITIALPGHPEKATAIVTLAPADKITLGENAKPLSECTLAELSAYGEALEAEVWDAYEAITLHDLEQGTQIEIEVMALNGEGQVVDEIEDWLAQAIVLTETPAAPEPIQTTTVDGPSEPEPVGEPERADVLPEAAAGIDAGPVTPSPTVAAEPAEPPEPPAATIIPSQARVRVAGSRLSVAESGGAAVDIFLDEAPLRAMQAHALSSLDREVAGVMIGRQPEKQPDGRYVVHVIDSIIAKHTVMQGASVTYTPESWRYMTDTLWERYPDESAVIVGWYHTHPGFGIFLSGMDLFIHQNFFTQIWHVAYVLDPRARTSGFFCWNRQRTKVNRYDFQWPKWAEGSW